MGTLTNDDRDDLSDEELHELELLTLRAEQTIQEMLNLLEEAHRNHLEFKEEIARLKAARGKDDHY